MRSALINGVAGSFLCPKRLRAAIYRLGGLRVPWRADIAPGCVVRGTRLQIGGSSISFRCLFDCRASVNIGDNCGIGMDVRFITSTHDVSDPKVRAGAGSVLPITVGDGCWIGSGAILLAGVTVGDGCVIAAGAIVNRDCDSHSIYGGVPARKIRDLGQ